jgi:hypothetical protein
MLYGAGILAVAASLGLGSWWAPGNLHRLRGSLPYVILVEDNLPDEGQSPDAVADAVIARVGLPRLTIPWEISLANDYRAAFWLIQPRKEVALSLGDIAAVDALWPLAGEIQELSPAAGLIVSGDPLATGS